MVYIDGKPVTQLEAQQVVADPAAWGALKLYQRIAYLDAAGKPSYSCREAQQVLVAAALKHLPPVPYGYYTAPCLDPEGGCNGWHCYVADSAEVPDPIGGYSRPTGLHYCDGGAPVTLAWRMGLLPARTSDEVLNNTTINLPPAVNR
jgi:hypothetical protein